MLYKMNYEKGVTEDTLTIGFAEPAANTDIVRFVLRELAGLGLGGGDLLRITGPASLPVAFVLAHHVAHQYQAVACYDPKLQGFVVCISHCQGYQVGQLIK